MLYQLGAGSYDDLQYHLHVFSLTICFFTYLLAPQVVFITAKFALIFISLSAVNIYDFFNIFTVIQ